MARRIDNIEGIVFVTDRAVLGIDRDAAFPLEFVGIHYQIDPLTVFFKHAALVQHGIDQGAFSGINVSDDG